MSGRPNPDGVIALRQLLRDLRETREACAELEKQIEQAGQQLKTRRELLREQQYNLRRMLTEMDVESPGNFGWEGRYYALLEMMATL